MIYTFFSKNSELGKKIVPSNVLHGYEIAFTVKCILCKLPFYFLLPLIKFSCQCKRVTSHVNVWLLLQHLPSWCLLIYSMNCAYVQLSLIWWLFTSTSCTDIPGLLLSFIVGKSVSLPSCSVGERDPGTSRKKGSISNGIKGNKNCFLWATNYTSIKQQLL